MLNLSFSELCPYQTGIFVVQAFRSQNNMGKFKILYNDDVILLAEPSVPPTRKSTMQPPFSSQRSQLARYFKRKLKSLSLPLHPLCRDEPLCASHLQYAEQHFQNVFIGLPFFSKLILFSSNNLLFLLNAFNPPLNPHIPVFIHICIFLLSAAIVNKTCISPTVEKLG